MERSILIVVFTSCFMLVAAVSRPRGVSLEKASFYQLDKEFRCLSDGKVFPIDHVNDDYCDCEDGSDEPGTSACPNGLFYCENKPHKGSYIKSSRVNDGICDCCDGSDEFDGAISCSNTCLEQFEQAKAEQEILRRNQADGYKIKQEYMQQGKRAKDEKLSQLSEYEKEKEILTSEKVAAEAAKTEAEEPETIAKEDHKKAWELVKEERQKVKDAATAAQAFEILDVNKDGRVDFPELMKHKEFDINSDGTVSEEEAQEYLEEYVQVDKALFTEKIWPNIKEIYKPAQEEPAVAETDPATTDAEVKDGDVVEGGAGKDIPVDITEGGSPDELDVGKEDLESYNDEEEEEEEEEEEDEDSAYDITDKKMEAEAESHMQEVIKEDRRKGLLSEEEEKVLNEMAEAVKMRGLMLEAERLKNETGTRDSDVAEEDKEPEYSEETKRLIEAADEARNKFDDADRKLRDHEREIDDVKKYLEIDFGPDQEYAALKGQCFEHTDREYTYRLCPFDKSTQKNKNGGIETSLGTWGKWHGPDSDKFDTMKYENGQGCWNGPSRSTHVNLHCGSTNEVTSASEPSRCEYQFEFTTPARCETPKPLDLNDRHDEL